MKMYSKKQNSYGATCADTSTIEVRGQTAAFYLAETQILQLLAIIVPCRNPLPAGAWVGGVKVHNLQAVDRVVNHVHKLMGFRDGGEG